MCGIVAVVRRSVSSPAVSHSAVVGLLTEGLDGFSSYRTGDSEFSSSTCLDTLVSDLAAAAERLRDVNGLLKGVKGLKLILGSASVRDLLRHRVAEWTGVIDAIEERLDICAGTTPARLERIGCELIDVRDSLWAIGRDRLGAGLAVAALLDGVLGGDRSEGAVGVMFSVHQVLSALDRLEVRGRDSAGLHLLVGSPAFDLHDPAVAAMLEARGRDRAFGSGSARVVGGVLSIVHKTAAEIGELGDNIAVLRSAVASDELLAAALSGGSPSALVLGHTRWASVGIISEPNAHPLDSDVGENADGFSSGFDDKAARTLHSADAPYVVAAVNGDVDNYAELFAAEGVEAPSAVTTDSKAVPVLMSRRMAEGMDRAEAFRSTVIACEGSVAVAAVAADAPDRLMLALRGSGQGLYAGLMDDAFIIASEPYGVVEETASYVRMDGDTPADPDDPGSARGQILEIDGRRAGSLDGLTRWSYDGTRLPISKKEVASAEITTRDIDRGDYPHFLLKEISEAPISFRKTLRGRIVESGEAANAVGSAGPVEPVDAVESPGPADGLRLVLGPEVVPPSVRAGLRSSSIRRVIAIGQGTAAVAGASLVDGLRSLLAEAGLAAALDVQALEATELSAFHLSTDMSDTLLIAVSQSGTTTDTNRTVDLARARGASVVAIVNRRNSDLTERVDGVLYTSDGRDVEMSVASTKAFYSQVAAGWLLAVCIADEAAAGAGTALDAESRGRLLSSLLTIPDVLQEVMGRRSDVARAARRLAPSRRHWAVVGNGANRVAAKEIRIKLSELCYKSIPCDATEDKKHIDLSLGAAGVGLRGGPSPICRRRHRQRGRHLPCASGRSRGDHRRRRASISFRFGGADRASCGSPAGVLARDDGRSSVRLRGGPGHRPWRPAVASGPGGCRLGGGSRRYDRRAGLAGSGARVGAKR